MLEDWDYAKYFYVNVKCLGFGVAWFFFYSARSVNNAIVAWFAVYTSFFLFIIIAKTKHSLRIQRESKKGKKNRKRFLYSKKGRTNTIALMIRWFIQDAIFIYESVPIFWLSIDDFIVFIFHIYAATISNVNSKTSDFLHRTTWASYRHQGYIERGIEYIYIPNIIW